MVNIKDENVKRLIKLIGDATHSKRCIENVVWQIENENDVNHMTEFMLQNQKVTPNEIEMEVFHLMLPRINKRNTELQKKNT